MHGLGRTEFHKTRPNFRKMIIITITSKVPYYFSIKNYLQKAEYSFFLKTYVDYTGICRGPTVVRRIERTSRTTNVIWNELHLNLKVIPLKRACSIKACLRTNRCHIYILKYRLPPCAHTLGEHGRGAREGSGGRGHSKLDIPISVVTV